MKEPNIQVTYHGSPSVTTLSVCESQSFFATRLASIIKASEEKHKDVI